MHKKGWHRPSPFSIKYQMHLQNKTLKKKNSKIVKKF